MFASQEKIDTARENELDSLADRLANLRTEFSDAAMEQDYLHTVSEAYGESRSEESALRIKELLREPESRRRVLSELRAFSSFYTTDRSLLEHRPTASLPALIRQIADLDKPVTEFKAVDGFAPAKATFITENEIDQFLMGGPNLQDSKIRIYSYFMQGHDAKECAAFLRHEYGDIGFVSEGWQTWSDGKGLTQRIIVGKAGLVLGDLTELAVQALNDIGRVYDFPNFCGICEKGAQNAPTILPAFDTGGILFPPFLLERREIFQSFILSDGGVDLLQISHQRLDVLITQETSGGVNLMDDTPRRRP